MLNTFTLPSLPHLTYSRSQRTKLGVLLIGHHKNAIHIPELCSKQGVCPFEHGFKQVWGHRMQGKNALPGDQVSKVVKLRFMERNWICYMYMAGGYTNTSWGIPFCQSKVLQLHWTRNIHTGLPHFYSAVHSTQTRGHPVTAQYMYVNYTVLQIVILFGW